jgi:hypothetical protein
MVQTNAVISKQYEAEASTLRFVVFSFLTAAFYYYCWILHYAWETERDGNVSTKTPLRMIHLYITLTLTIISIATYLIPPDISLFILFNPYVVLFFVVIIVCIAYDIYITFRMKDSAREILNAAGYNFPITPWKLVIFRAYYLYYLFHNAAAVQARCEKRGGGKSDQGASVASVSGELLNLAKLKEVGIITEEEFDAQKKKLLK